jgi:large subunit ribosomal protein L24
MSVQERANKREPRIPVLIRKGDLVRVVSGPDRLGFANRSARVLAVDRKEGKVTVEHANIMKKHTRRNPQKNVAGGVLDKEAPLNISNVMIVCPSCDRPTRIGSKVHQEGGRSIRSRVCKRCGGPLDK